jgi:hypothetical protein
MQKIVVHEINCQRVLVVFNLFAESVGQPGKPTHSHPQWKLEFPITFGKSPN